MAEMSREATIIWNQVQAERARRAALRGETFTPAMKTVPMDEGERIQYEQDKAELARLRAERIQYQAQAIATRESMQGDDQ